MELHNFNINVTSRSDRVNIIPCADWHLGSASCDVGKLKELLNWVAKTPNTYIIGLGDYIDAINLSDPRFTLEGVEVDFRDHLAHLVQKQADEVITLLTPLAKQNKIIGLALGNHEFTVTKHYHYDPMIQICGTLKVRFLGWCALTRLRILRNNHVSSCIIFTEHSRIAGRLKGGKINSLEARSNDFDADIFIRAHSHEKICTTKTRLYVQKDGELKLREKKMVYIICP